MAMLDDLVPMQSVGFAPDPATLANQQAVQDAAAATAARFARQRRAPQIAPFGAGATAPVAMLDTMPGMAMATAPGPAATMPSGAPDEMAARLMPLGDILGPSAPQAAPPLPPPVDIGSMPVAGTGGPGGATVGSSLASAPPTGMSGDDAVLPASATPAIGTGAPGGADAAPTVPPSSLFGRIGDVINAHPNALLALGAGLMGAPSLGTGLSRGFAGAQAAGQQDIKQQQLNTTVQALMRRGLPQDLAVTAAANPAIMGQLLPQLFGVKQRQFTQIGEDYLGNKKFGFVDPVAGKVYNLDGSEFTAQNAGAGTLPMDQNGQPLQGQPLLDYLEKNDPVAASGIRGLLAGNVNAQGRNLQKLAPLAERIDPTFSMATFPQRVALLKSYQGGGKDFQETQALNTVSGHLGHLMESADGLGNSDWIGVNKLRDFWSDNVKTNPAVVKFRNDLVTTQNELARAYHGGHVSDSAYAAFNNAINSNMSPAGLRAAIGELARNLGSKIEAKESAYKTALNSSPLPNDYRAINDAAQHSFDRIGQWANGVPLAQLGQAPGAHAPAAAPAQQQASAQPQLPRIASPAEAAKLPRGTHFLDPTGVERVVP